MTTTFHPGPPQNATSRAGLLADRPAASGDNAGSLYFATDDGGGTLYRSNGTSWVQVSAQLDSQLDDVWVPITEFTPAGGSPNETTFGSGNARYPVRMLDSSSNEGVSVSRLLPAHWSTYDVELHWGNAGAGSGDVVWQIAHVGAGDGEDMTGGATTETSVTDTAGAQGVKVTTTLKSSLAVDSDPVAFRVIRLASDAADTLGNDAGIIGLLLRRAS